METQGEPKPLMERVFPLWMLLERWRKQRMQAVGLKDPPDVPEASTSDSTNKS